MGKKQPRGERKEGREGENQVKLGHRSRDRKVNCPQVIPSREAYGPKISSVPEWARCLHSVTATRQVSNPQEEREDDGFLTAGCGLLGDSYGTGLQISGALHQLSLILSKLCRVHFPCLCLTGTHTEVCKGLSDFPKVNTQDELERVSGASLLQWQAPVKPGLSPSLPFEIP